MEIGIREILAWHEGREPDKTKSVAVSLRELRELVAEYGRLKATAQESAQ